MKKLALCLLFIAGNAWAETWELPPVVDNSGYPPQSAAPSPANAAANNSALYQLMARLEQLQKEVQQLTGKLEEQAYLLAELKKQQKTMYADFDDRLQAIENKGNAPVVNTNSPELAPPAAPPPADVAPSPPPPPVSQKPAQKPSDAPELAAKKSPAPPPPPPAKPTPPASVSANEKQDYDNALTALRTNHTAQAIEAFNAYLQKYPANSYYADNARFHLGEAYHVNNNAEAARKTFNTLMAQRPNSSQIPDALLMLGVIELKQKNTDKARDYFNQIRKNYPTSSAAARAAKKLEALN